MRKTTPLGRKTEALLRSQAEVLIEESGSRSSSSSTDNYGPGVIFDTG
jgi:hypothetical protein